MLGRLITNMIGLVIASLFAATASAADYRGTASGWPTYTNGTYAANYPANYANGAYYVARPVAAAGYAQSPGAMYVPATAAYANPSYFAAYGRSPVAYRPVSTAGYAPVAGGYYAPNTAYYAPTTANYAPANSYAVTPAGIGGGSEAAAYYGQPTSLNYVPPRVAYRPTYASAPVYMYRPVTAYQPVAGYQAVPGYQAVQPVTCMQASTCNMCQAAPQRCFSFLNPFTWFGHRSSCGGGGCGTSRCGYSGCGAAPTTAYCGQAACGQQPYYPQPMTPVIPVYPTGPTTAVPANTIPALPRGFMQPAQPTIPPPPTVQPGTRTIIGPAETRPSLAPQPGTTFPAAPGTFGVPPTGGIPVPPAGSFQTQPQPPPTGFGTGSFGTGTNYTPAADPYSATMTPVSPPAGSTDGSTTTGPSGSTGQSGPNHSVFGSGYRGNSPVKVEGRSNAAEDKVIRAPGSAPALPPSVKTVPDLDAPQSPRPVNAAPQLIDPRDKTAFRDPKWAVVPAQWPTKQPMARQLSERPVAETKAHQAHGASGLSQSPYAKPQPSAATYDDGGWKSAAF